MLAACLATVLLFHPAFVRLTHIANPWLARTLMGLAMGLTALAIIKSPWGKRSGAQFNPAITLVFLRLGKIGPTDAICYILSHFAGGIAGVALAALIARPYIAAPQVNYAVTIPGLGGPPGAFAAETFMAALLMAVVLYTSNKRALAPYTPWLVGLLISQYVLFLAPVSGFSINPARTLASAVFPPLYTSLWIYFTAPPLGMFLSAELFLRLSHPDPSPPGTRHYLSHRHLVQRNHAPSKSNVFNRNDTSTSASNPLSATPPRPLPAVPPSSVPPAHLPPETAPAPPAAPPHPSPRTPSRRSHSQSRW
jgi:aquaporin Z